MSLWTRALISVGSVAGAATIAAVQIPPETATSNLAAWARMFGFNRVALALPPSIDNWVTAFGLSVAVTCLLVGIDIGRRGNRKAVERSGKRKSRAR
jgi:hypothetical protein